jgi:outer membrane protein TolC
LSITQPIFQDAGRAVVEAPIRIAQANHQQAVHDFQTVVRTVLRETEEAYWTVYLAKRELDIQNDAFYQAADTFEREEELLDLGEGALPDLAEAETQFEAFRIARAQAQFGYDAAQRNLTRLLGFPVDYSREVVPETAPEVEPVNLDWSMAVVSVQQRPEILAQQATIRAAQTNLFLQENGLAPDIDVGFDYAITGLADRFDDSMDIVGDNDFNNWTLGLSWQRPFGRLVANAAVRQARLALSREMAALEEIELEVMHELHQAYQRLVTAQRVLEMHARRRAAAAQQLEARRELYLQRRATLDLQLEAEQIYAIARLAESAALTEYQQALVAWRFASGTMFNSGVVIDEAVPTPESDEAAPAEAVDPAANDTQAPMPPQIQRVPMP